MNTRPLNLTDTALSDALVRHWGFIADRIGYMKVGAGSHHWLAKDAAGTRRFVTVHDLAKPWFGLTSAAKFKRLRRAFTTASTLRSAGLEFVIAPLAALDGGVLHMLEAAFSIAVFPHVDGDKRHEWGDYGSPGEREAVIDRVGALHRATSLVVDLADREDFALPLALREALGDLNRPWSGGPYSEVARGLFRMHEVDLIVALRLYDELVARVRALEEPWVITHGEPTPGNLIWTAEGPCLVDWETVMIAPAACDLWMLESAPVDGEAAYALYRLRWELTNIGIHVGNLRGFHEESEDTMFSGRVLEASVRLDTFHAIVATR